MLEPCFSPFSGHFPITFFKGKGRVHLRTAPRVFLYHRSVCDFLLLPYWLTEATATVMNNACDIGRPRSGHLLGFAMNCLLHYLLVASTDARPPNLPRNTHPLRGHVTNENSGCLGLAEAICLSIYDHYKALKSDQCR